MAGVSANKIVLLLFAAGCVGIVSFMLMKKQEPLTPVLPAQLHEIKSKSEFDALLAHTDKPVVVKFSASWCPPCRAIKPIYVAGANQLSNQAYFGEIDIDAFEDKDYLKNFDVKAIPTIIFFKQGTEVKRIQSLNNKALKEELSRL